MYYTTVGFREKEERGHPSHVVSIKLVHQKSLIESARGGEERSTLFLEYVIRVLQMLEILRNLGP
jgi:hypothetical protein